MENINSNSNSHLEEDVIKHLNEHRDCIHDLKKLKAVLDYYITEMDLFTVEVLEKIFKFLSEIDSPVENEYREYEKCLVNLYESFKMHYVADDALYKKCLVVVCSLIEKKSTPTRNLSLFFYIFPTVDIQQLADTLVRDHLNDNQIYCVLVHIGQSLMLRPSNSNLMLWIYVIIITCESSNRLRVIPIALRKIIRPFFNAMLAPTFKPEMEPYISYVLKLGNIEENINGISDLIPTALEHFIKVFRSIYYKNAINFILTINELRPQCLYPLKSLIPQLQQNSLTRRAQVLKQGENCAPRRTRNLKTGLVNIGNTCYMNSVLQTLAGVKDFTAGIFKVTKPTELFKHIQLFYAILLFSKRESLYPELMFKYTRPSWFNYSQQDSAEYLNYLLEYLHNEELGIAQNTETKKLIKQTAMQQGTENDESKIINSNFRKEKCSIQLANELKILSARSTIERSFDGKTVVTYKCLVCHTESKNVHTFRDLQLSFPKMDNTEPGNYNIQELIDYYCSCELLDGQNQYFCNNCEQKVDASRMTSVIEPPHNLILVLKYCQYNKDTNTSSKLLHKVCCNLKTAIRLEEPGLVANYELTGVIVHTGKNMNIGHYYSFRTDQHNEWFKCNDNIVTKSSIRDIQELDTADTPYILFYEKNSMHIQDQPNKLIKTKSAVSLSIENLPPHVRPQIIKDNQIQDSKSLDVYRYKMKKI